MPPQDILQRVRLPERVHFRGTASGWRPIAASAGIAGPLSGPICTGWW